MSRKLPQPNRVPKVPGALGARPLPQPRAKKWAGWASRKRRVGRLAMGEVIVTASLEADRLAVRVENGDVACFACVHFTNAPERQIELGRQLADGLRGAAGGGEAEFVIVAARQLAFERDAAQVCVVFGALGQVRELNQTHRCGAAGALGNMTEIGQ